MLVCTVLKISQVMIEKALLTFTSRKIYYISVDLLHGTMDAKLHNPVNLLCGTAASELDKPV